MNALHAGTLRKRARQKKYQDISPYHESPVDLEKYDADIDTSGKSGGSTDTTKRQRWHNAYTLKSWKSKDSTDSTKRQPWPNASTLKGWESDPLECYDPKALIKLAKKKRKIPAKKLQAATAANLDLFNNERPVTHRRA